MNTINETKTKAQRTIFNAKGRKVRTLLNHIQSSGNHVIQWDGRDDFGNNVSIGIYFYRFQIGKDPVKTRKMLLIR